MSDHNGLVRPAATGGYKPSVLMTRQWNYIDDEGWFTMRDADIMRRDPHIRMGLRFIMAPLKGVTFEVTGSQKVATFVYQTITDFWKRYLGRALKMIVYGFAAGEIELAADKNAVRFARWIDWHYADVKPWEYKEGPQRGKLAGAYVRMGGQGMDEGKKAAYVDRRHLLWITSEPEYNSHYGQSRLAGAYLPWREQRGRHGAISSRRLWYVKNAFSGGIMRHPPGTINLGEGQFMSCQDYARQILEKHENGGTIVLPNTMDEKDYQWTYESPKMNSAATDIREYAHDLGQEMWLGMGIPPEMVQASERGSGFSGRSIPALGFFSSEDEIVSDIVTAVNEFLIRPLVDVNFGSHEQYTIKPSSLLDQLKNIENPNAVAAPEQGGSATGGDPFAQSAKSGADTGSGRSLATWEPYIGPSGGRGKINRATGVIKYDTGLKLSFDADGLCTVGKGGATVASPSGWVVVNGSTDLAVEGLSKPVRVEKVRGSDGRPMKKRFYGKPDQRVEKFRERPEANQAPSPPSNQSPAPPGGEAPPSGAAPFVAPPGSKRSATSPGPNWVLAAEGPRGGLYWVNKGEEGQTEEPAKPADEKAAEQPAENQSPEIDELLQDEPIVDPVQTAAVGQAVEQAVAQHKDTWESEPPAQVATDLVFIAPPSAPPSAPPAAPANTEKAGAVEPTALYNKNASLPDGSRPRATPAEQQALRYYVRDGYLEINNSLRGVHEMSATVEAQHKALSDMFARVPPFENSVVVRRGMFISTKDGEAFSAMIEDAHANNRQIQMAGYTSTSTGDGWEKFVHPAYQGHGSTNVRMTIDAVHGIDASAYGGPGSEKELLLNHNSRFEVVSRGVAVDGSIEVHLRQLLPAEAGSGVVIPIEQIGVKP